MIREDTSSDPRYRVGARVMTTMPVTVTTHKETYELPACVYGNVTRPFNGGVIVDWDDYPKLGVPIRVLEYLPRIA